MDPYLLFMFHVCICNAALYVVFSCVVALSYKMIWVRYGTCLSISKLCIPL